MRMTLKARNNKKEIKDLEVEDTSEMDINTDSGKKGERKREEEDTAPAHDPWIMGCGAGDFTRPPAL